MFDVYWYDYSCIDIVDVIEKAKSQSRTEYVWVAHIAVDYTNFNWHWLPNIHQKNFYHAWPSHSNIECLTTWLVPVSADYKSSEKVFHTEILPVSTNPKYITDDRIDYSRFDFSWYPSVWEWKYRHEFTMIGTKKLSYTTLLSQNSSIKYNESQLQWRNEYCFDKYWYDYDDCTDINSIIKSAQEYSQTPYVWVCHKAVDYSNFNFNFLPELGQENSYHGWASHSNYKCYTTWLVPKKQTHPTHVYHSGILPVKYGAFGKLWNWKRDPLIDYSQFDFNWFPDVFDWNYNHEFTMLGKERLSYTTLDRKSNYIKYHAANLQYDSLHYDICCINTGTHELPPHDYSVRLITTIPDALQTAIKKSSRPWLWVISDICDYTNFDFNWLPEEGEEQQIHCWPSGSCKKGDTFLIHIPSNFGNLNPNYNFNHISIPRKPWPIKNYDNDTLCLITDTQKELYNIWVKDSLNVPQNYPDICIWENRPVVGLNKSNSISLIPRDYIFNDKEIYQYPYLLRYPDIGEDIKCDIIMISNGESCTDKNWKRLCDVRGEYKVIHISGVNGRLKSYQTAAKQSESPWFIAVFAKCYMLDNFIDFNWQPDFWQEPKHYIFYNHNLDNDLTYGHMAPIAYNKKLMLENTGGLDMTLAQKHTVVPITISQTTLRDDPWLSWRTAFREVVKIIHYNQQSSTVESEYRLHVWKNSKDLWQRRGAEDAELYYTYSSNGGDESTLLETSEWNWLENYFNARYSAVITV